MSQLNTLGARSHGGDRRLSKAGRRVLMQHGHKLDPVIMVGKNGLTEELLQACEAALDAHELIKVRFQSFKGECGNLASAMAEKTGGVLVQAIGHVAVLYRQHIDPSRRRYDVQ